MNLLALIAAAVGLAPDAAEEKVISEFGAQTKAILGATSADSLKGAAEVAKRNAMDLEALKLAHEAQKKAADEAKAELAAVEAAKKKAALESLISGAVTSGRLPPAKREAFAANAEKFGEEWAKAALDMLPVVASNEPPPAPRPAPTEAEIDEETKRMLAAVGLTPEDHRAAKARGHV